MSRLERGGPHAATARGNGFLRRNALRPKVGLIPISGARTSAFVVGVLTFRVVLQSSIDDLVFVSILANPGKEVS